LPLACEQAVSYLNSVSPRAKNQLEEGTAMIFSRKTLASTALQHKLDSEKPQKEKPLWAETPGACDCNDEPSVTKTKLFPTPPSAMMPGFGIDCPTTDGHA
jgi:hypothetical protein